MLHPTHAGSALVLEGGEPITPLQHPEGIFIAVGIEDSTTSVAVRERVALGGERMEDAYRALIAHPAVAEIAILCTCHRTELYMLTSQPAAASDAARVYLLRGNPVIQPYVREWRDMQVVEHLLRVSAGLESRILGEQQILAQVWETLARAKRLSTMGSHLHQLFRSAIACGREVRRATGLGQVDATIAVETARAAELATGPMHQQTALVVGGGEVSRLTAAELRRREIGKLYLANRTPSVARDLADRFGGVEVPLAEIGRYLPSTDIVVSATSAPWRILTTADVRAADLGPRHTPLHLFDLAMPRDIDPAIGELPGVILHDLDSLLPARIWEQHEEDMRVAELIVGDHLRQFDRWYRIRRVAPLIAELRRQMDEVTASELHRASPRFAGLRQEERDAVASLTNRLTDAIVHRFVMRLRLAACTDDRRLMEAARFLFRSDPDQTEVSVPIEALSMAGMMSGGGENR